MDSKKCNHCFNDKLVTDFHYWNNRKSYSNICEQCYKKERQEYRKNNIIKIKAKAKEYRESGKASDNWHKWAKEHPDELKAQRKKTYIKNIDKIKAKRDLHEFNSQTSEYRKTYRENNKTKFADASKKYTSKQVSNVTPNYCSFLLKRNGFTEEQIKQYPELIKTKQLILKTKRLCKTLEN